MWASRGTRHCALDNLGAVSRSRWSLGSFSAELPPRAALRMLLGSCCIDRCWLKVSGRARLSASFCPDAEGARARGVRCDWGVSFANWIHACGQCGPRCTHIAAVKTPRARAAYSCPLSPRVACGMRRRRTVGAAAGPASHGVLRRPVGGARGWRGPATCGRPGGAGRDGAAGPIPASRVQRMSRRRPHAPCMPRAMARPRCAPLAAARRPQRGRLCALRRAPLAAGRTNRAPSPAACLCATVAFVGRSSGAMGCAARRRVSPAMRPPCAAPAMRPPCARASAACCAAQAAPNDPANSCDALQLPEALPRPP